MSKKIKLLILIDWFLPAYKAGGPIQSVSNLVNHFKSEFDIYVATSNSDLDEVLDIEQSTLNQWIIKEDYHIIYIDRKHQNLSFYKKVFLPLAFEVVYFNSLFSKKFTLLPLLLFKNINTRKVLAPRGMLGKGALNLKSYKKIPFLKLFKLLKIYKDIIWHATAQTEADDIKNVFGNKAIIKIAPNLSAKMGTSKTEKIKKPNHLKIFFLSRIAVKKNLLYAIKCLKNLDSHLRVDFSIIGPQEEKQYWSICLDAIKNLPDNISVKYRGPIPHYKLAEALIDQHLLFLPTQHENFGHVIIESWQNGCPVIISDQTPWRDLDEKHLGADISLSDPKKFTQTIEIFARMNESDFNFWSNCAYKFADKFINDPNLIEQNKALFLTSIENV